MSYSNPETAAKKPFFRDNLSIEDESGKRRWIFPKRPKGRLTTYRASIAAFLLACFFAFPHIRVHGEPFFLLNFFERKFILFGQVFWPQDFYLLALSILVLVVSIVLFTVIYGRVFCGWACPQTIFMEFFFRQMEYIIEGDFQKQRKLSKQPWNLEKILKKSLKHLIFIIFSLLISNTMLAYIVGVQQVREIIGAGPGANTGSFLFVLIFGTLVYFIFAWLREFACILICPYGRLQGVLLDDKSIVVAYDYERGEPRAPFHTSENRAATGKGDCIECSNCVQVCPTGIDIRNGTQLECINCTACIDACNNVMKRVKLPAGLIRYDSEKGISSGKRSIFNTRSLAYSAILLVLLSVTATLYIMRSDIDVTILRVPGSLYQQYGPDKFSNIYNMQVVNKTRTDLPLELNLGSFPGEIIFMGEPLSVPTGELVEANFLIVVPKTELKTKNTEIIINLVSDGKTLNSFKTNFISP